MASEQVQRWQVKLPSLFSGSWGVSSLCRIWCAMRPTEGSSDQEQWVRRGDAPSCPLRPTNILVGGLGANSPHAFPYPGPRAVKRIQSHGLRPWEGKWEEPAGITPASLGSQPGKSSRALPYNPLGPQGPRPHEWVHRISDKTQPGQLPFIFYFQGCMGANPP